MSKTAKRKARTLKKGSKFQVPAQAIIVKSVTELGSPTLEGKIRILEVTAEKGPLNGLVWHLAMHDDEDVAFLLKNPWPRRCYEWAKNVVWGS